MGSYPRIFFADDLSHYFIDFGIHETRPIIIETIRNKASNARLIADSAIKYAEGKYDFDGTEGGTGEIQLYAYLCSKDPALITQGVWNALYRMGLIDFATWEDANYEVFSDFVLVASLATAVFTAGASLLLSARNLARRLFRAGAQDALAVWPETVAPSANAGPTSAGSRTVSPHGARLQGGRRR